MKKFFDSDWVREVQFIEIILWQKKNKVSKNI